MDGERQRTARAGNGPSGRGPHDSLERSADSLSGVSNAGGCKPDTEGPPRQDEASLSRSIWRESDRADPSALVLADRHYNRQKIGSPQFVPPGRCLVLLSQDQKALWVTSYPFSEYVRHAWAGAWVNSLFRNEGAYQASDLIREAIARTKEIWDPPERGIVTFVDPKHVAAIRRRLPPIPLRRHCFELEGKTAIVGYCYLKAGFTHVGYTKGGLWTWQMLPHEMPPMQTSPERLFSLRRTPEVLEFLNGRSA